MNLLSNKNKEVDMINSNIFKTLALMAIPLALTSILQQLFTAADTAVVGRFASSDAMAAVGSNAPVINVIITLLSGISVGANVMIASFIGQGRHDEVNDAVHTSFSVAIVSGLIMTFVGLFLAKPVLIALSTPNNILNLAVIYLRIYFLGITFIMIYNIGSAILRSIGDTQTPLICLIISGLLNVILNLFFVIVCNRSADGVAMATTISNGVSAILVTFTLMKKEGMLHLDLKKLSLKAAYIKKIFVIGGPAGIQGAIFSFSNVIIQTAINSFGSDCIAGNSAALNFEYMAYFVVNGFAQAYMTFISQNYAAGSYTRCRRSIKYAMASSIGFCALVSVSFYLLRYPLIGLFTSDSQVIYFAMIRMTYITLLEPLTSTYEITGAALRGMGKSMLPAVVTLIGCCGIRLVYIFAMSGQFTHFDQVVYIYSFTWIVTGATMIILYLKTTKKMLTAGNSLPL